MSRRYAVSLSGGLASAVCAQLVIDRYGKDNVDLVFCDTLWEDDDLYRFLDDLSARWAMPIIRIADGRTPLQVAEDQHIVPNSRIAPCSKVLKVQVFERWIAEQPKPLSVCIGLDWTELHRLDGPRKGYGSIPGVSVNFPLLWEKSNPDYAETVQSWGIKIPRLYTMGFSHNNCGGRCVRQGHQQFLLLREKFPERFAELVEWETPRFEETGYAFSVDRRGGKKVPLPLVQLSERNAAKDDAVVCVCNEW